MRQTTEKNQNSAIIVCIFITKAALLMFVLYGTWYIYIKNFTEYYNSPTGTRWQFLKNFTESQQTIDSARILFLGESRLNAGVDFMQIPNSFNLASGGSSPIENYFLLKKYLATYPKPDTVFLSISPRFIRSTFAFWPFAVRNGVITASDFAHISAQAKTLPTDTFPGVFAYVKFAAYQAAWLPYYQTDVWRSRVFTAKNTNLQLTQYMSKNRGKRPHTGLNPNGCSGLNVEASYTEFTVMPIMHHYFEQIFATCAHKGIYLIFEPMPFNESSLKACKPAFISQYNTYIMAFAEKYPQFAINKQLYAYPDRLFGDPSHLNAKGTVVFTKALLLHNNMAK